MLHHSDPQISDFIIGRLFGKERRGLANFLQSENAPPKHLHGNLLKGNDKNSQWARWRLLSPEEQVAEYRRLAAQYETPVNPGKNQEEKKKSNAILKTANPMTFSGLSEHQPQLKYIGNGEIRYLEDKGTSCQKLGAYGKSINTEGEEDGGVLVSHKAGSYGENSHMAMASRGEMGMGPEFGATLGEVEARLMSDKKVKPAGDAFAGVQLAIRKGKDLGEFW